MHTCIHMYLHIYVHIHTYIHAYINTRMYIHSYTYMINWHGVFKFMAHIRFEISLRTSFRHNDASDNKSIVVLPFYGSVMKYEYIYVLQLQCYSSGCISSYELKQFIDVNIITIIVCIHLPYSGKCLVSMALLGNKQQYINSDLIQQFNTSILYVVVNQS